MFHAAAPPSQEEVEAVVYRTAKRALRFLEKRGVIEAASAPGDGEVTIVGDDTLGETDPLLARLLAATAGVARGISRRGQRQTRPGNFVPLRVAPPACE